MSFDISKIRKDFPMLNKIASNGKPLIYFDNGATTFKPQPVIDAVNNYYYNMTANAHRGDYDLSHDVDVAFEEVRVKVANFINAKPEEIVYCSGTTEALNQIAYGIGERYINEGDEIIISEAEHASNVLPWYRVTDLKKAKIKFVELDHEGKLTLENIKKVVSEKTKVISLAHVGNVLGYLLDVKALTTFAHLNNILVVIDGAQSVPHFKVDVKELDIDFLTFSGHKMLGPTGIGIMYGKLSLLNEIPPLILGGGMNTRFDNKGNVYLKKSPFKFEAGTPPIESVIGFGAAIDYLTTIGMDNIQKHEHQLRAYAIEQLTKDKNIILYNNSSDTGIITFNYKGVFSQDMATFLNSEGIAVRSGQHCAKLLNEFLKEPGTVRASFYLYNTFEEVDRFIECCKRGCDYLDVYFK